MYANQQFSSVTDYLIEQLNIKQTPAANKFCIVNIN